jgi:hypothetical protein
MSKKERNPFTNPHLTPEHYESEGKGWEVSKQSARSEFLKWLDAFVTEKQAFIRKARKAALSAT